MKRRRKPAIIFILGPTSVGKSGFAVKLAKRIGGEIISCDSMQVYRGMKILSQQPDSKSLNAVPHHLIGILSPAREWSAADFIGKAKKIIKDIVRRDHIPIVVGGSGLYARALAEGLFPSPTKDERLRKRLYNEAKKKGKKRLYKRLLKIDPSYASRIHPNDLRRIIRALEVYELTGKAISEQHKKTKGIEDEYEILTFVLDRDRSDLYKRINENIEKMFSGGLVEEIRKLERKKISRTAIAALGYKEISDYINGRCSAEEAKELLKKNTRHYAKRQLTWFRKEKNATWFELGSKRQDAALLSMIAKRILR
jgi:tRNA dimethylallyltransferase